MTSDYTPDHKRPGYWLSMLFCAAVVVGLTVLAMYQIGEVPA